MANTSEGAQLEAQLYAYSEEYKEKIGSEEFEKKLQNDFDTKIKFTEKNSIIIGNPEGLDIKNIITSSTKDIDIKKDNIVILGNIVDSTFSKNPQLSKDLGNDDTEKLQIYYRNIIEKKSYNNANIEFCNNENVIFIIGNREIDKIKIKDLVELNETKEPDETKEPNETKEPTKIKKTKETNEIKYTSIEDYIENRKIYAFKIDDMSSFYPFWVKFYFKDSYKISTDFKFIRRFKKIFKAIDAEMLLFTIYYELYKDSKNQNELLKELTNLAIIYFYKMKNYEKEKIDIKFKLSGDNEFDKFISLNIIDKLDYLAYCVFKYFYEQLSTDGNLYKLLKKADFILTLKANKEYYLLSHGGITQKMFVEKSSSVPVCISKLESFIEKYKNILTDISLITKKTADIVESHNIAKKNQIKYYEDLFKDNECNVNNDVIIDFKEIETNIQSSDTYNLLLYYSVNKEITKINELLLAQQQGGYVSRKQSSYKGFKDDLLDFDTKRQVEIEQYNDYLKNKTEAALKNPTFADKPTNELLLLLMMAHSFNTKIFNELLEKQSRQITESDSIKSKDCSVIINTIFDHRINHKKEHVLFKNVHQITANSNNTTQPTEAIYDFIFYGTIIDCYEIIRKTGNDRNYLISIDNTSIIKHYSYFDSYSCLIIAPDLKSPLNKKNIAVKTLIQTSKYQNIIIYNTLEHLYKILNHEIKEETLKQQEKGKIGKVVGAISTGIAKTFKSNFICPKMNYYGIDERKTLVFSDSKVNYIEFHGYNFDTEPT
jgi:hypothetical protein